MDGLHGIESSEISTDWLSSPPLGNLHLAGDLSSCYPRLGWGKIWVGLHEELLKMDWFSNSFDLWLESCRSELPPLKFKESDPWSSTSMIDERLFICIWFAAKDWFSSEFIPSFCMKVTSSWTCCSVLFYFLVFFNPALRALFELVVDDFSLVLGKCSYFEP